MQVVCLFCKMEMSKCVARIFKWRSYMVIVWNNIIAHSTQLLTNSRCYEFQGKKERERETIKQVSKLIVFSRIHPSQHQHQTHLTQFILLIVLNLMINNVVGCDLCCANNLRLSYPYTQLCAHRPQNRIWIFSPFFISQHHLMPPLPIRMIVQYYYYIVHAIVKMLVFSETKTLLAYTWFHSNYRNGRRRMKMATDKIIPANLVFLPEEARGPLCWAQVDAASLPMPTMATEHPLCSARNH